MENNSVASVKDPSITNLCNLSKTSHIVEAVNKANNVLGLIKNIQSVLQKRTFSSLHTCLSLDKYLRMHHMYRVCSFSKTLLIRKSPEKDIAIGLRSAKGQNALPRSLWSPCTGRRWVIEDCTFPLFKNFLPHSISSLSTLCLFCCQLCHYFCGKQWQNCPVRRRIANSLELLPCTLLKSADLFYAYSYIRWKNQAHSITRLCHRQPTKKLTSSW